MEQASDAMNAITEVLYRWCRAVDRMDRELADNVWHRGGTVDYGFFQGDAREFVDVVWDMHAPCLATQYQLTNLLLNVDGDRAQSEAYITATVWTSDESGTVLQTTSRGRYLDRWSCRDGVWGIDHRQWVDDFTTFTELDTTPPDPSASKARRDRSDPSYGLFGS